MAQTSDATERRLGIGVSYGSEDLFVCTFDVNGWMIGAFGKNWSTAEKREAGTSNYGRTKIGETESVWGFDLGYAYPVLNRLRIGAEASVAWETTYGKYQDGRFTEGYYLSEEEDKTHAGVGAFAAFAVTQNLELTVNASTIKGYGGGIMLRF